MPTPSLQSPTAPDTGVLVVVAARNEADRIAATIGGLRAAFPGARVWVADDGSTDGTAAIAERAGATVVCGGRGACRDGGVGKGQAMTVAVETALASIDRLHGVRTRARVRMRVHDDLDDPPLDDPPWPQSSTTGHGDAGVRSPPPRPVASATALEPILVLCDGDLGESAPGLAPLVEEVRRGEADLAVAAFSTRASGGFGIALAFARWAVRRRCGLSTRAPLSGQRAMRARVLRDLLPFAAGYGMEIAMTIDAVRAGHRVVEIPMRLSHRPTGRTPAGFAHRGRQLVDCVRVYRACRVKRRE